MGLDDMAALADSDSSVMRTWAELPMGRVQVMAVCLAVALNALDGFDVLAITFAAPGIAQAWGVGPAQLGVALSSGLAGMALGSLVLAPLGDRVGRRPLILGCLVLMAIGMALTATATGIFTLCVWRVLTGLGIGGMLAALNAVAAEFANERRRDLCVALMAIGYPVGGLIGGFVVADFIVSYGWESVFLFGAAATTLFLPLAWFWLPESIDFLSRQNGPAVRHKIDLLLARMGHPSHPPKLQTATASLRDGSVAALLGPRFRRVTVVLVSAYFLHMLTYYFFSGWVPKLMSDLGHPTPDAVRTSALMSLGGVIGGSVFGWLAPRFGLVRLVVGAMLATSAGFAAFGSVEGLYAIQVVAFLTGVAIFGGIVGLYALLARSYPPELRVTGTGMAIGIGRGGAIIGPLLGGLLIANNIGIGSAVAAIGLAAAAAAFVILIGRLKTS